MAAPPRTTSKPAHGKDADAPPVLPGIEFHAFLDTLGVALAGFQQERARVVLEHWVRLVAAVLAGRTADAA